MSCDLEAVTPADAVFRLARAPDCTRNTGTALHIASSTFRLRNPVSAARCAGEGRRSACCTVGTSRRADDLRSPPLGHREVLKHVEEAESVIRATRRRAGTGSLIKDVLPAQPGLNDHDLGFWFGL